MSGDFSLEVRLDPNDLQAELQAHALEGLTSKPKTIPAKWFYDERGSALFDEITRLPEYYLTRAERDILETRAVDIARWTRARTVIELGSGTSEKTHLLLAELAAAGTLKTFVPFDVDEATIADAGKRILDTYPGLNVHGVVGDFTGHLSSVDVDGPRLVAFLGSTIGNFEPRGREILLREIGALLDPADFVLIGYDLLKDRGRLEAAYNDSRGVTADFNLNMLRVLNRELEGDFDLNAFEHVAFLNQEYGRIEMHLRSKHLQSVTICRPSITVRFDEDETLLTEISCKFTENQVIGELAAAGLEAVEWWTDPAADFALGLARLSAADGEGENLSSHVEAIETKGPERL